MQLVLKIIGFEPKVELSVQILCLIINIYWVLQEYGVLPLSCHHHVLPLSFIDLP